jgi:ketopantoate reductase
MKEKYMKKPVVVIGIGEMGGVFSRGFLRLGYPVYPVTREVELNEVAENIDNPELVLVAVAEGDLHAVLETVPEAWRDRLVLLQNELLPGDWKRHELDNPTVISVWFEKKKGQDAKVIIPSPVFGPKSRIVHDALLSIGVSCKQLNSVEDLLFELVVKNVYILTTNIAGLETGGNVGELWGNHQHVAKTVSTEVIKLQQVLTNQTFNSVDLIAAMVEAFNGDLEHKCMGRSASARLGRALDLARQYDVDCPKMSEISANIK